MKRESGVHVQPLAWMGGGKGRENACRERLINIAISSANDKLEKVNGPSLAVVVVPSSDQARHRDKEKPERDCARRGNCVLAVACIFTLIRWIGEKLVGFVFEFFIEWEIFTRESMENLSKFAINLLQIFRIESLFLIQFYNFDWTEKMVYKYIII